MDLRGRYNFTHTYMYILSYVGFVFTVNTINFAQDVGMYVMTRAERATSNG